MEELTLKEEAIKFAGEFNSYPTNLLKRAYDNNIDNPYSNDYYTSELINITPVTYSCPSCEKTVFKYEASEMNFLCDCEKPKSFKEYLDCWHEEDLDEGASEDDFVDEYEDYVDYESYKESLVENTKLYGFPMWGTMWSFKSSFDRNWCKNNLETVAEIGFQIYEDNESGEIYLGLDCVDGNFYENFWSKLYLARKGNI